MTLQAMGDHYRPERLVDLVAFPFSEYQTPGEIIVIRNKLTYRRYPNEGKVATYGRSYLRVFDLKNEENYFPLETLKKCRSDVELVTGAGADDFYFYLSVYNEGLRSSVYFSSEVIKCFAEANSDFWLTFDCNFPDEYLGPFAEGRTDIIYFIISGKSYRPSSVSQKFVHYKDANHGSAMQGVSLHSVKESELNSALDNLISNWKEIQRAGGVDVRLVYKIVEHGQGNTSFDKDSLAKLRDLGADLEAIYDRVGIPNQEDSWWPFAE